MTVENCIKLLKAWEKNLDKPVAKRNYENMKEHILNSRKFQGHPILQELTKDEVKKDGKKPKR